MKSFVIVCLIVLLGCTQPGTVKIEPGAATMAPGAVSVDANAVVEVLLASPKLDARLAEIIKFSPAIDAAFTVAIRNSRKIEQASGQQTASEGGVNIGTVSMSGAVSIVIAALAGMGLTGLLLWKLRKSRVLTDMLVSHNEDQELDDVEREELRGMALSRNVEGLLRKRIAKVRKG